MSVSNVSNSSNWISQLAQLNKASHANRSTRDDGIGSAKPAPAGGSFVDAIAQALSQVGLDTTSTSTVAANSTSGTETSTAASTPDTAADPAQALSSFLQNLLAALQAQGKTGNAHDNRDGDKGQGSSTAAIGKGGVPRQNMESDLQSLIQNLSAAGSSASGSTDTTRDALQQSFQTLVEALGGAGGKTTLPGFLKAFANNIPGASMIGGVVSTLA